MCSPDTSAVQSATVAPLRPTRLNKTLGSVIVQLKAMVRRKTSMRARRVCIEQGFCLLRVFQRTHSDGFRFDAQVAEETAESVEKATARASEEFAAELATLEAQVLGLKTENAALKDELNAETPDTSSVKRARS
jgi:hypothetical protein